MHQRKNSQREYYSLLLQISKIDLNYKQGKPLLTSLCDKNTGRLIRQHQNAKLIFGQNLQKRSKIEKVNISIKLCIFKLVCA